MTVKRKPRGTLARLEALEGRRAAQMQAVEDVKGEQTRQALDALDVATLKDLKSWGAVQEEDGPAWARFLEVGRVLAGMFPDSTNPVRPDAVRWVEVLEEMQEGLPFPVPDRLSDFVAYFDEEVRNCEAALAELEGGRTLPDGMTPDEAVGVIRYARAGWKLWGGMGRVLADWWDE